MKANKLSAKLQDYSSWDWQPAQFDGFEPAIAIYASR